MTMTIETLSINETLSSVTKQFFIKSIGILSKTNSVFDKKPTYNAKIPILKVSKIARNIEFIKNKISKIFFIKLNISKILGKKEKNLII